MKTNIIGEHAQLHSDAPMETEIHVVLFSFHLSYRVRVETLVYLTGDPWPETPSCSRTRRQVYREAPDEERVDGPDRRNQRLESHSRTVEMTLRLVLDSTSRDTS